VPSNVTFEQMESKEKLWEEEEEGVDVEPDIWKKRIKHKLDKYLNIETQ
jgi:hypothetical protein